MTTGDASEGGLPDLLQTTSLYDWLQGQYERLLSWPEWLRYAVVAAFILLGPVFSQSYRTFAMKLLVSAWSWLRRHLPVKSILSDLRERRRVRRVRKQGRLEAGERMSQATKILPYLNGPDAEKVLRRHCLRVSDDLLSTRRLGGSYSVLLSGSEQSYYFSVREAEQRANPVIQDECALWLLSDSSVIVAAPDGSLEVGTKAQEKAAQEAFSHSMKTLTS